MSRSCVHALEKAGIDQQDLSLVIAHQANKRIIDAIAKRQKSFAEEHAGAPIDLDHSPPRRKGDSYANSPFRSLVQHVAQKSAGANIAISDSE